MSIRARHSSIGLATRISRRSNRAILLWAACALLAGSPIASATIYNPFSFTSLGTLDTTGASSVAIDTNAATITLTISKNHTTYTGVYDTQNGMAGIGGAPYVAVFDFDKVTFAAGVPVFITGNNGLAILSATDFTANSALTLNGQTGVSGATASSTPPSPAGGTGGGGGFAGGNGGAPLFGIAIDPGAGAGNGSTPGNGPGGGSNAGLNGLYNGDSGGGGAFGGQGGTGTPGLNNANQGNPQGPAGGNPYGLTVPIGTLTPLYGGSGGGGGNFISALAGASSGGGGGGGGGAIEIVAAGNITLNNGISVNGGTGGSGGSFGGSGGGGSGGDMILVGNSVTVSNGATANGASGGSTTGQTSSIGGGGGGGRILVDSDTTPTGTFNVTRGGTSINAGLAGTVQQITSALTTSAPNLLHRRGTTGSGNLTITTSGTAGSVVFADFLAPSGFGTHVAGLPANGNTFTLDPFTPTTSYNLTDTTTTASATGTLSFTSNVGTVNIPIIYGAAGPQFSANYTVGGAIDFGAVNFGSSKTIMLNITNNSTDLGGTDISPLTQLDLLGQSLAPTSNSVFSVTDPLPAPIYEGHSVSIPITFSPNDNTPFSQTLQIYTDNNAAVGASGTSYSFTLTGIGQNPLLGDANYDSAVNSLDYNALINGYDNHLTGWSNGDFNQDGVINADDFALFAKGVAEYDAGLDSAPEPTEIAMLSLLMCPLFKRRR